MSLLGTGASPPGRVRLEDKQLPRCRGCGRGGQVTGLPRAHHQGVLDPDAAPAGQVDARFDGDGNPVSKSTGPALSRYRRLVDLQTGPVGTTGRGRSGEVLGHEHVVHPDQQVRDFDCSLEYLLFYGCRLDYKWGHFLDLPCNRVNAVGACLSV